jgi:dihydroneopterin aldolase/2-amino-4-hydroxy-6-hydroxymethyldihydropteridine diphosphokinase
MDKIKINNLEVFCNHGLFKEENVLGQKFLVSAVFYVDTREAGLTDNLVKSIHYGEICQYIERFMKQNTYKLIEAAAENLAMNLLMDRENLIQIDLEIKKPWAPIGLPIETVAVEISRKWHTAYIALGSNIGDKKRYLEQAVVSSIW